MTGSRDDRLLYVDRHVTHDHCLQRTERLLPADSQDGHREFHLLENFVVCRIGGECGELREASPHASGLCVGGCEEISGSFVGFRWIAREIVPDSVEIDALATCDKPLCVGTVEVEMPDARIQENRVPRLDAGNGRVHHHQTVNLVRVGRSVGVSDHVADVVGDYKSFVESERGDYCTDVLCFRLLVVSTCGI